MIIHPGRPRTERTIAPPNPVGFAFSKIPASQQLDTPRSRPEPPREVEWCHEFGFWKAVQRNSDPTPSRPTGNVAIPMGDGSRVHWRVVDRETGATLWRIEAGTFDVALAEKRRLCRIAGGRSGHAYLRPV